MTQVHDVQAQQSANSNLTATAFQQDVIGWHDRSWTILDGKLTMLEPLNIY